MAAVFVIKSKMKVSFTTKHILRSISFINLEIGAEPNLANEKRKE